jgi:hypothetical protein
MNEDEGTINVGQAEGRKIEMQLLRNGRHIVTFMLRDDELATRVYRDFGTAAAAIRQFFEDGAVGPR